MGDTQTLARGSKKRAPKQLTLPTVERRAHGGARRGAGRKPKNPNARRNVSHRRRPEHSGRSPVLVTLRVGKGIPALRHERLHELLKMLLCKQAKRDYGPRFQIVHYSIQNDHLHFIVEAQAPTAAEIAEHPRLMSKRARRGLESKDRDMLRRGIAGIAISVAKELNKLLARDGAVWADRHHRRELESPNAVRNALRYVLQNYRRHGARVFATGATDVFSTGASFDGWSEPTIDWGFEAALWAPRPRTWLLARGWRRAGSTLSTQDAPPLSPRIDPSKLYKPHLFTARELAEHPGWRKQIMTVVHHG